MCEEYLVDKACWKVRFPDGAIREVKSANILSVVQDPSLFSLSRSRNLSLPQVRSISRSNCGLFSTAAVASNSVVYEEFPFVFHELSAAGKCEGCTFRGALGVRCENCNAVFCSPECRDRSTAAWHGVICGNPTAMKVASYCDGVGLLGKMRLGRPWCAAMGAFKMLLALLSAARRSRPEFDALLVVYREFQVPESFLSNLMAFNRRDEASAIWEVWQAILEAPDHSRFKPWFQKAHLDKLPSFFELIAKYHLKNRRGALYRLLSFSNHSCRPNAAIRDVGCESPGGAMRLIAVRSIMPGDELHTSLINPRVGRTQRQAELLGCYAIDCKCSRCTHNEDIPSDEMRILDPQCTVM